MRLLTEWLHEAGLLHEVIGAVPTVKLAGFQDDSRHVKHDEGFFAIEGTARNGWDYVPDVIEKGARVVLGERDQVALDVPYVQVRNARAAYARLCAVMFARRPAHCVAVTGTNGKTSVADFYRQLWALEGANSASVGTLGLTRANGENDANWAGGNTSPGARLWHQGLQHLADAHVTHLAVEASSHGLDQHRLDGTPFEAAAFTNLTQDHLDYHGTMEAYFEAKARLFSDFGATALINADDAYGVRLLERFSQAKSFGENGTFLRCSDVQPTEDGLQFMLHHARKNAALCVPLYGAFQLSNIMAAGGLALLSGLSWEALITHIPKLRGVRGRMEKVATHPCGAPIFIDYAHTPDALKHLLISLRAHTCTKLHVVFGCGGDRDKTKRAPMGSIAAQYADEVIVTDDNPRSEEPASIRQTILSAASSAQEVPGRDAAIQAALQKLKPGDILVVAGKGHETYQEIGTQRIAFSDAAEIQKALEML